MLIDYEFTGWNPRAMDLANYINETQIDNNYKENASGIKFYPDNAMSEEEIIWFLRSYLE